MKLEPGDIVEIEKSGSLAYVQVTHNHPSYPEIIRVLPGLHQKRAEDVESLADSVSREIAMFPLGCALANRRLQGAKIGNALVPKQHMAFPTFGMPIRDKQGGVAYWWLWDGEALRYETELAENEANLPLREVISVSDFMEMLG